MILSKSDFILWGMGIKVSNITPTGTVTLVPTTVAGADQ